MGLSDDQILPVKADAEKLPFEPEFFDAVVSTDSYNYFGRDPAYLDAKLLPFVKKGGQFISYKSGDVDEEFQQAQTAITLLGGKVSRAPVRFALPGSDMQRTLLVIDKVKETPGKYPRRPGTPSKEPLGH